MAVIAQHSVPGTTITIYISQMTRGFQVMAMGDPRFRNVVKTKTVEEAKAKANEVWAAAVVQRDSKGAAPAEKPSILGIQAQIDADDAAMDRMVQAAERDEDRAVAALKASMW